MSDIPSELNDRFEVQESLPAGRTGQLFRVTEKTSGRKGVLKIVAAATMASSSDRQRVKRELAKQSTLAHSGLALPIITGETGKTVWLFREWIDGQTLRERLAEAGALPVSEVLATTSEIAAALDELHRAGLLFRDLKPEHIVFARGRATLIDAGLAARVEHDEVFDLSGTPAYLSPEQCKGKLVSFRSDLYALGCVLYEMASGRAPYAGAGGTPQLLDAHQNSDAPEPPDSLPEGARELLKQLLQKDPRKRPFSAQQVRRTLDPLLPEDLKSGEMAIPDGIRTSTLPGMPAVGSSPPRPPSLSRPPRPPSMNPTPPAQDTKAAEAKAEAKAAEAKAVAAKKAKKSADATQQVKLDQIVDEKPLQPSIPPPTPADAARKSAPAAKADANTTQPIQALDILDEEPIAAPAVAAAAAPVSQPPPPSAVAAAAAQGLELMGEPEAAVMAVPAADVAAALPPVEEFTQAAEAALASAASVDDLDYDDDAPTMHRDAPSGLEGMQPQTEAHQPQAHQPQAFPQVVQHPQAADTTPGVQPAPEALPAPAALPSHPAAAVPVSDNRNGLYMLMGGAMVFLAVCLFIGYQMFSGSGETLAAATNTAQAPTVTQPTVDPTPMQAVQEPVVEEPVVEEPVVEEPVVEEPVVEEPVVEEPVVEEPVAMSTTMSSMGSMRVRMRASMGGGFDAIREQARTHFQAGRFRQAAQAYQRATAMNPRHAGSWSGLGAAKMQLRDYRGAVTAYQRAVQLNPRSSGFFTSLGHALRLSGNRNGARQAYQRAVAINPRNGSAQQWLTRL